MKYIKSDKLSQKEYYLEKLNSSVKFWMFYDKTINYLLTETRVNDYDKESMLKQGPLERYQLTNLIDVKFKYLKENTKAYRVEVCKLFYGFGILQGMSKTDIVNLQKSLEKIRDNFDKLKNQVTFIFLGSTNHWVRIIY